MTTVLLITLISILSTSQSRSLLIVNNQATESSHFSSCYVSLRWGEPPIIPFLHVCAGGVIDEQWILTAGHCVEAMRQLLPPGKGVFEALPKIDERHRMEDGQKFSVDGLFPHEEFNFNRGVGGPYDIGLIKLDKPINLSDGLIEKAQLPLQDADVVEGEKATVYEWGRMRTVIVPIIDTIECNEAIQKAARVKGVTIKHAVNETNICTTAPADDVLLCYGDSGGPLTVRKDNGQREIVGIASWIVLPCGGKGTPAVWTKVSSYVDWIESVMKNN